MVPVKRHFFSQAKGEVMPTMNENKQTSQSSTQQQRAGQTDANRQNQKNEQVKPGSKPQESRYGSNPTNTNR